MVIDSGAVVVAVLTAIIPTVFGFLTSRSIKQVDAALATLTSKVELLGAADSMFAVQIAELRVRVTQLEFQMQQRRGE